MEDPGRDVQGLFSVWLFYGNKNCIDEICLPRILLTLHKK